MLKWLVPVMIFCLAATGCGTVARNESSPSPQNTSGVHVQQTEPRAKTVKDPRQVAAHLEELAMRVPGVKGAHCVVFQNTAVVGIDVDPSLDRARVGTIKYSVAEALRKDPYGVNAAVTADMDMAQRLREMGADIGRGRPIAGFTEELADIIGRIVPQMPRDTARPEPEQKATPEMNKHL